MAVNYNPTIVSDGLVLCLDVANTKSYDGSENLLTYSEQFDNAAWARANAGIVTNTTATLAPDESYTAEKLVEDTANAQHLIYQSTPVTVGSVYTLSCFVKSAGRTQVSLTAFGEGYSAYDLSNGTIIQTGTNVVSITPYGNGWYRCVATITKTNTNGNFYIIIWNNTNSYTGNGTSGIYIWGAQLERGSVANPYYPTTTTTKTRGTTWTDLSGLGNTGTLVNTPNYSATNIGYFDFDYTQSENVTFSNTSSLQFLNRLPYTLEAWVYPTRNPGTGNFTGIFDREDSSTGFRDGYNIYVLGSATPNIFFYTERFSAGVNNTVGTFISESVSVNSWQHIVATYDGTTLSLYRNASSFGTPITSTGNISNTSKSLTIGVRGGQYFGGRISNTKIYNRALTASEVQQNFNALRGRFSI